MPIDTTNIRNASGKRGAGVIRCGAPEGAQAYRVDEFARTFRLSRSKLYELINAGSIRSVTVAGRRLIPASEGERILREGCE